MKQCSLAVAPRRGSTPPGFLNDDKELKFRSKREVAFREYYYLAFSSSISTTEKEQLLLILDDPSFQFQHCQPHFPDSWFPDGALWDSVAEFHGVYAVNEIAKQLSSDT